jgi:high-affinity iron transporter
MLAAFVIVFREATEAGLIVGIVLAATRGLPARWWWIGAGIIGGLAGAAAVAGFAGQIAGAFQGAGQELFNAGVLVAAVAMLGWHNVWMARHGRELAREMHRIGSDVAAGRRPLTALAVVVGLAVLREGSEAVLFLYGVAISDQTSSGAVAFGGLVGVAAASGLSAVLYLGLLRIPPGRLFAVTTAMVTLLAAGLASQAIAFLQQAGYAEMLTDTLWDSSWLLSDESLAGRLLHTLIGYTAAPTGLQAAIYLATIGAIVLLMRLVNRPMAKTS